MTERMINIAVINGFEIEWGNVFSMRSQSNVMDLKIKGRNSVFREKKCAFFHKIESGMEDL